MLNKITAMIDATTAYLRDFAFDYCFLSESFETSLPWSNVIQLCRDVTKVKRVWLLRLGVFCLAESILLIKGMHESIGCE